MPAPDTEIDCSRHIITMKSSVLLLQSFKIKGVMRVIIGVLVATGVAGHSSDGAGPWQPQH